MRYSSAYPIILEKSVGSQILAQAPDSTALQKNTRLTEWVKLCFFQSTVKPIACTIIPRPTDLSRIILKNFTAKRTDTFTIRKAKSSWRIAIVV
jgi:hypothetical protein